MQREASAYLRDAVVLSRIEAKLFARIMNGRRIVDVRNQLTHAYLQVDDRIVWLIARDDVPVLRTECDTLLAEVGDAD